jgi:hypothetical protein
VAEGGVAAEDEVVGEDVPVARKIKIRLALSS